MTLPLEKLIYACCWAIAYGTWVYFSDASLGIALAFGCCIGLLWYLLTSTISTSLSYFKVQVFLMPLLVTLSVLATSIMLVALYYFRPLLNLSFKIEFWVFNAVTYFLLYFNFGLLVYIKTISTRAKEDALLQQNQLQLAHQAGLQELQHKFQPHFLYNSLNTINALVGLDQNRARKMIINLSDLLRRSVAQSDQPFQQLTEEISTLEKYLAIEQERFGDRLQVNFNLPIEGLENILIPPFLLQPVLENAIKFGLNGTLGKVTVEVNISIGENTTIEIVNPTDEEPVASKGTGHGLKILRKRLFLAYQRQDLLNTDLRDGLFYTTITIPNR
jgi:LytS/YehU family sensor histidine kinase